jgi:cell division septum initiation protein DivIVA
MAPENRIPLAPRPGSINASAIVRTDFAQVRRGGFDPEQVTEHLNRVANYAADLERRVSELEAEVQERRQAPTPDEATRDEVYQSVASRVADLVRSFDEEMERARAGAFAQADAILSEAKAEADRMMREADEARVEVQRSADETLVTLEKRRTAILENVRRIHDGLAKTVESAESVLAVADEVPIRVDGVGTSGITAS